MVVSNVMCNTFGSKLRAARLIHEY